MKGKMYYMVWSNNTHKLTESDENRDMTITGVTEQSEMESTHQQNTPEDTPEDTTEDTEEATFRTEQDVDDQNKYLTINKTT